MEVSKENKAEDVLPESETNGDKTASDNEETVIEEVVEPEISDNSSEKDEIESEEKADDKSNENSIDEITESQVNDSDNKTEKTTVKRKIDDVLEEDKNDENDVVESEDPPKEVIEDENPPKKLKKAEEKDPLMNLPVNDVFGKGKRARIPNKRYSDIAISPSVKTQKSLENGDREKVPSVERIEPELLDTSSPLPKRAKTSSVDLGNPNFLKPFNLGWKRELVWRAIGGDVGGRRNGDIYYYSPEGKKLRSMREVAEHLNATTKELTIEDFTFFKEPLGVNDPEKEVIRDAKIKSGTASSLSMKKAALKQKKISSPKVSSPKISSPKVLSPKIEPPSASTTPKLTSPRQNSTKTDNAEETKTTKSSKTAPSTPKTSNSTDSSGNEEKKGKSSPLKVKLNTKPKTEKKQTAQNKQAALSSEEVTPMVGKKATPRKSNKWSQNSGSSGDIVANKPCQPCSIRCPGVQGFVPTLQCRLCLCLYHNECVGLLPNITIPNYICKNCQLEQGGENLSTGIAPPPLTPITALQSVTAQSTALPKLQRIPKSPEGETAPSIDNADKATQSDENSSILGHVTSWLPQNSRIEVGGQQRSPSVPARPQYVEYLAGRKFLIIPKYNVVSVSPTAGARSSQPPPIPESVDPMPAQTADVAATAAVKSEPVSPSKPENSQTSETAHPHFEPMEIEDEDVKPIVQNIDLCLSDAPVTSEASVKSNATTRKKTIKLNNITNQTAEKTAESLFMGNYLQNLSYGYNTLLHVFQYLKVQDLLRAGCVCTMWRDIASHPSLWRTVRMKNSQVHSFEGLANTLKKHGTVQLDLRKMLLTNCDDIWPEFSSNIGKVDTLRKIELCRCPASVVEKLTETNPKLEVVNAVTIRCETMNLEGLENWENLRELRLKSTTGLTLKSEIESLKSLVNLKILSLTSIRDLNTMKLEVISQLTNLESLDLGECTDFPENFGKEILSNLTKLEKLRLEKGQGNCHTFEIFEAVKDMKQLEQLELVNFDIKAGFDKALGACKNIKKLLIIPTYISQSATTNHMVLGGVLRLQKSLSHFVWGVTLELLRVTELFVDQCEEPEKKEKKEKKVIGNGDSIPVLKPVPLITEDNTEIPPALDPPQVEILALPGLQKLLLQSLPSTRVKILKIPFHATWRQTITDAVN